MHISKIPSEVIDRIIHQLPRKTVYQCMLVCKNWYNPALTNFYNTFNLEKIKGCVMDKKNQELFKKHHHLVKTLEFGNFVLTMKYGKGMSIYRLFCNLSQLKMIDLRKRRDAPTILCALKSALDDCPRSMRDLRHVMVSTINDPLVDEQIKSAYYGVCYKRRQCITHLNVYPKDAIHIGYLRDYPSLTHLYIYNSESWKVPDEERDRLLFAKVLTICPNLIELEIFNSPTFGYLRPDKKGPRSEYPVPAFGETSRGHVKMYNKNLKKLHLTLESFDVAQMEYIITYIPAQKLGHIVLHLAQHNTLKEWIQDRRAKTTLGRFIQHACKSKKFRIQIDSKYSENEDPAGEQVLDVNALLWSIAHTIEESRKIDHCQIKLTLTQNPSSYEVHPHMQSAAFLNKCNLCFDVSVRNHALIIHHRLEYSDFFHQNGTENMAINNHLMEPTSLLLSYWNPNRFIEDATKILHLSVPQPYLIQGITFAFINFPNLVSLEIDNNANGDNDKNKQGIICKRIPDAYFENKEGRFGLYKLELNNAALAGPLTDRICYLMQYVSEMIINDGIFYNSEITHNTITLNFTQMTHLKKLTLNFPFILQRYSNTLVQIKTENTTTSYKSITRNRKHTFVEVSPIYIDTEPNSVMVKPRILLVLTLPQSLDSIKFGEFKDTFSD